MDTPQHILDQVHALTKQAKALLAESQWDAAEQVLSQAIALDDGNAFAMDLLAKCYAGKGQADLAAKTHARAKQIRDENWKRQVEGDIRSHHDLLGKKVQHEIP